ncbi:hypothetical protein EGR_02310 [Echinococcus granulosus]|uniref:Uncharacterized protein n=1 Tax=Echinococcus granulosus TaxID=6210 RepID=W6V8K4_ECHGR|nr:hypothetical protein EGR_02310 [Echinococcus granulosus]EUB62869.1 hypothetical protein EGR_02310 [Echinococcus granulosus]
MVMNGTISIHSYDLDEFILISPADPKARRLDGDVSVSGVLGHGRLGTSEGVSRIFDVWERLMDTKRVVKLHKLRILLGTVDKLTKDELPLLVSYGNDKLYYGLRLSRGGSATNLSPSEVFVPDSGLKKIEYAMSLTSLPHKKTHLVGLRDIFLEKVGSCEETPNVSVLQYFRMVKLKFQCSSHSHTASLPTNTETPPPEMLCSDGMKSLLDASAAMPGMPAAYLSPEVPSSEALDDHLTRTLGCRYTGAAIHTLLIALHLLILRLRSTDFLTAIAGAWYGFLSHLRCTPNCELFPIPNVGECSSPVSSIDQALYILCQHPKSASSGLTSMKDSEEEFFDALEDQVVHHAGPTAQYCAVCRSVFEELESASPSSIAKWIAPYVLAHHISLFHRFGVFD